MLHSIDEGNVIDLNRPVQEICRNLLTATRFRFRFHAEAPLALFLRRAIGTTRHHRSIVIRLIVGAPVVRIRDKGDAGKKERERERERKRGARFLR